MTRDRQGWTGMDGNGREWTDVGSERMLTSGLLGSTSSAKGGWTYLSFDDCSVARQQDSRAAVWLVRHGKAMQVEGRPGGSSLCLSQRVNMPTHQGASRTPATPARPHARTPARPHAHTPACSTQAHTQLPAHHQHTTKGTAGDITTRTQTGVQPRGRAGHSRRWRHP